MDRLKDVFGDSAFVAEDLRKTAYELEDKHNVASYPMLEAADHIESLYVEALKMQAELEQVKEKARQLYESSVMLMTGRINAELFDGFLKGRLSFDELCQCASELDDDLEF